MQCRQETATKTSSKEKILRTFFFVAGSISLALGSLGIVLPVLPTTPFLLLALACYCRSSQRMTHWMLNNKYFGQYIKNYREGKGIPLKTKIYAIAILWVTITISNILVMNIWMALFLYTVAVAVTVHLVRLPTYHKEK